MKMCNQGKLYYDEKKNKIIKADDRYFSWRSSYLMLAVIEAARDCDSSDAFLDATNEQLYSGTTAAPVGLSHKQITAYNKSIIYNRIKCLKAGTEISNEKYYC